APVAAQPEEHLHRAARGHRRADPVARGSFRMGRPGRGAAEQGANRGCLRGRVAPEAGLEAVTDAAMAALAARGGPLVAVLWGKDAQALAPALAPIPIIASAHPSPLSARRGFFGSKPFTRANALLVEAGGAPIDWALPMAAPRS